MLQCQMKHFDKRAGGADEDRAAALQQATDLVASVVSFLACASTPAITSAIDYLTEAKRMLAPGASLAPGKCIGGRRG